MDRGWNPQQVAEIVEQYWRDERPECPDDGSVLAADLREFPEGYALLLRCPRCGKGKSVGKADDPAAPGFRDWTDEEKASVLDAHFKGRMPRCPVDGAGLIPAQRLHVDGNLVRLRCPRCGRSCVHSSGRG